MRDIYVNEVLRERWNDTTRTYTSWNAQGVQTLQRAYTAAENAAADTAANIELSKTNRGAIEANILQDLATMQTIIDTPNATINSSPASYIKDIARAMRRLERMALAKFDGTT